MMAVEKKKFLVTVILSNPVVEGRLMWPVAA
jgi:hypothetical protein